MKKVRYVGELPAIFTTLNIEAKPGDVIEVPDDVSGIFFEDVVEQQPKPQPKEQQGGDKQ